MSRSFGDEVAASVGTICDPEIKHFDLTEEDKFIIIASDGIWEFISSQECVEIIKDYYISKDLNGCLKHLFLESSKRWIKEEEVIDGIKFKVEYEEYNNELFELNIPKENKFKYVTEENFNDVFSNTNLIYLGRPNDNLSRNIVNILINNNFNITDIYYVNLDKINNELNKDNYNYLYKYIENNNPALLFIKEGKVIKYYELKENNEDFVDFSNDEENLYIENINKFIDEITK